MTTFLPKSGAPCPFPFRSPEYPSVVPCAAMYAARGAEMLAPWFPVCCPTSTQSPPVRLTHEGLARPTTVPWHVVRGGFDAAIGKGCPLLGGSCGDGAPFQSAVSDNVPVNVWPDQFWRLQSLSHDCEFSPPLASHQSAGAGGVG